MKTNRRSRPLLVAFALAGGIGIGLAHPAVFGGVAGAASPPATHIVAPGETLWGLAGRYAPSEDPRHYLYDLQQRNHLGTAPIYPGETLILP